MGLETLWGGGVGCEYLAACHWFKDNNSGLKCNKLNIPCGPNTWEAHAVKNPCTAHTFPAPILGAPKIGALGCNLVSPVLNRPRSSYSVVPKQHLLHLRCPNHLNSQLTNLRALIPSDQATHDYWIIQSCPNYPVLTLTFCSIFFNVHQHFYLIIHMCIYWETSTCTQITNSSLGEP